MKHDVVKSWTREEDRSIMSSVPNLSALILNPEPYAIDTIVSSTGGNKVANFGAKNAE